jgi:hypothetical protein
MVQGEKGSMLTASSCVARTSDPFARKAGFEAMQRADKGSSAGSSSFFGATTKQQDKGSSSTTKSASSSSSANNSNGAWGPLFQNKQNFASMHFC